MAKLLSQAYRVMNRNKFHAPTILKDGTGDFAKLRYWGLVAEVDAVRPDGGRAGWWQVTADGERFVLGLISMPLHVLVHDGVCLKLDNSSGTVSINDAMGEHFNYSELMSARVG